MTTPLTPEEKEYNFLIATYYRLLSECLAGPANSVVCTEKVPAALAAVVEAAKRTPGMRILKTHWQEFMKRKNPQVLLQYAAATKWYKDFGRPVGKEPLESWTDYINRVAKPLT